MSLLRLLSKTSRSLLREFDGLISSHLTHLPSSSSTPDTILINGKGRFVNGPHEDLAVISVKQNTKYR